MICTGSVELYLSDINTLQDNGLVSQLTIVVGNQLPALDGDSRALDEGVASSGWFRGNGKQGA